MDTMQATKLSREAVTPTWAPPIGVADERVRDVVRSFLDHAATGMGRATHYNDMDEVRGAELRSHGDMLALDRSLYAAFLTLPGVTDRTRQLGVRSLLMRQRVSASALVSAKQELVLVDDLLHELPATRMLRLLVSLRGKDESLGSGRVNTNRARKLVLRTLLRSRSLDWWAVKYRDKLSTALTHAWGVRKTGILRSIVGKEPASLSEKEHKILREEVDRWAPKAPVAWLRECVAYTLGAERKAWSIPVFYKARAAKTNLAAGQGLPLEVLQGIAATYHPKASKAQLLELSKGAMSAGQRMAVQRQAKDAGVDVEMDPTRLEAVKLYIYAFEMGMTPAIERALNDKARKAALQFPFHYESVGVVVDSSASMFGSSDQKLRPMATALATRDMLLHTARQGHVRYVGGTANPDLGRLVRPRGETDLASALLQMIRLRPDVIYVISDGYENAPAGRFADVCAHLKRIGIRAPIVHINPVVAAETSGVRELAPGLVPTLPMTKPDASGISLLRAMLDHEPRRVIDALLRMTSLPPRADREVLQ